MISALKQIEDCDGPPPSLPPTLYCTRWATLSISPFLYTSHCWYKPHPPYGIYQPNQSEVATTKSLFTPICAVAKIDRGRKTTLSFITSAKREGGMSECPDGVWLLANLYWLELLKCLSLMHICFYIFCSWIIQGNWILFYGFLFCSFCSGYLFGFFEIFCSFLFEIMRGLSLGEKRTRKGIVKGFFCWLIFHGIL